MERKSELTVKEKQKLIDYEEINKVYAEYVMEVTLQERKEELIKSIRELGRLPKQDNNGVSERTFRDGTSQRSYYNNLKVSCKKMERKSALTVEETQKLMDYEEINKVCREVQMNELGKIKELNSMFSSDNVTDESNQITGVSAKK